MFVHYTIALLAIIVYLHGFFPVPVTYKSTTSTNHLPEAHHGKLVLIVIDALRYDFVTPVLLPKTHKIVRDFGCFSKLKVETPTVTLPRLKALTTGSVAQFTDIIVNLVTPEKLNDSFIHQARLQNKSIVFYGDETWLKIFRGVFTRSEVTKSFYVTDFYEVDLNVTRNLELEIERTDWDIMILHYLGLDHIGHVHGPKSSLIAPKLLEMDEIIAKVYAKVETFDKKGLVLVTSDHGMKDSGGHGGSTLAEVTVPFLALGLECKSDFFAQIDVAANLAVLFGTFIPSTSIGQLKRSLLASLTQKQYFEALKYNTELLQAKLPICTDLQSVNSSETDLVGKYENCSRVISERLQKSSVEQNLPALIVAIVVLCHIWTLLITKTNYQPIKQVLLLVFLLLPFFSTDSTISYFVIGLATCLLFYSLVSIDFKSFNSNFIVISLINSSLFLSTSYIEEEHQFWYFIFISYFAVVSTKSRINFLPISILVLFRFLRTLNQVGDKFASVSDLSDFLVEESNFVYLQALFLVGLGASGFYCYKFDKSKLHFIILALIYLFRLFNNDPILGRVIWGLILAKLVIAYRNQMSKVAVFVLVACLLLKPYNTVLIPLCVYTSQFLEVIEPNCDNLVILHWCLGHVLYFLQGNDNSIASVDVSAGYIGLTDYHPLFVLPQVICHTFALPALTHLLLFKGRNAEEIFRKMLLMRVTVLVVIFTVTFFNRDHLFIWSVFAPKLFVDASHFGFMFIEVCVYFCNCFINKIVKL